MSSAEKEVRSSSHHAGVGYGILPHSVPTRELFHTVKEKNHEPVYVSQVRAHILHSPPHAHMSHSKTAATQCVPLHQLLSQSRPSRVSPLASMKALVTHQSSGHTSKLWSDESSLPGGEQDQNVVRTHRRETREGILRRASSPWPLVCTLRRVSGIIPPLYLLAA